MNLSPYEVSRPLTRPGRGRLRLGRLAIPLPRRRVVLLGGILPLAVLLVLLWGSSFHYESLSALAQAGSPSPPEPPTTATVSALKKEQRQLKAALARKTVSGNYIVVDITNNKIFVRNHERLLLNAICSTGSGIRLKEGDKREWEFHTPRGMFKVRQKVEDPLWKKPDWAFVEEQEPVPTDPSERIEAGMMGEYGLHFGNGYLIHGTLYERLLGRSVTHGCIRVGRTDLKAVYEASKIGTPIIIY